MKYAKSLLVLSLGLVIPVGSTLAAGGVDDTTMMVIENDHVQSITQHIQLPPGTHEQNREHERDRFQDRQHEVGEAMHEQHQEMQEHTQDHMSDVHDGMGQTHDGMGHP